MPRRRRRRPPGTAPAPGREASPAAAAAAAAPPRAARWPAAPAADVLCRESDSGVRCQDLCRVRSRRAWRLHSGIASGGAFARIQEHAHQQQVQGSRDLHSKRNCSLSKAHRLSTSGMVGRRRASRTSISSRSGSSPGRCATASWAHRHRESVNLAAVNELIAGTPAPEGRIVKTEATVMTQRAQKGFATSVQHRPQARRMWQLFGSI